MELVNWIFFGPSKLITTYPYAGFFIAALFIGAQLLRTAIARQVFNKQWFRKAPVFTGLLWAIFNLYEMQLAAVLGPAAAQAAANAGVVAIPVLLRLDLIVLTPLLYVLTAFALYGLLFSAALPSTQPPTDNLNADDK